MERVLTFVCTDLVDSTEILARFGESRAEVARHSYFGLVREATAAAGGREWSARPDGVTAVFESPSDALTCAVAMQRAFARHNAHARDRLDVRIGVQVGAVGEGDESRDDGDRFPGPVFEARRLCEAALGGQILVSNLVQALAGRRCSCSFSPIGLVELRGLAEPLAVSEVVFDAGPYERVPLPPELAPTISTPSRFVGRAVERQRLVQAWRLAESGERQLAFLLGEPGIGKSRLAAEFAVEVHDAGAVVLWGRCSEDALVPYQPFVQALRHYVASCDEETLRSPQVSPLVRLLPELAGRVPVVSAGEEVEAETERYRLFEAIAALLARVTGEAPLLLVLDDLQWADQGTLLLLRNLVFDVRTASMLVLGTYRDSEVARRDPLTQLRADAVRERPVELIELDGLSEQESAALVGALLGWSLPEDVARTLFGETEGNPFFLEEVVRHLEGLGVVSDPESLRRARLTVDELGVPRRVKELVARRVQRLSASAVEALQVASVIGSEFRLELLARVLGDDEQGVVALLDQAVDARLLAELPGRIGAYGFTHALIQQALYEEQTANRRATLHARIAETLESLQPAEAAALAHHFALAGERGLAKVVGYGRAAGEQALDLLAYEDAASEFARALSALATIDPGDVGRRAELLVLLGGAKRRAGDAATAESVFAEAAELAARAGAAATLAQAALGYGGGTGFGGVWTKLARVDAENVRFLEQALAAVPERKGRLRVQLLGRLAQALYWGSDEERGQALELSEEALAIARELGDPVALAHALDARHTALWEPENLELLRPLAKEMLGVGTQLGDREIQLQALAWLITDALENEPLDVFVGHLDAHARLAAELRQPYHLWFTEATRAMRAHLAGRFAEMSEAVEAAWLHGQTAHHETAQAVHSVQLLYLKLDTVGSTELIEMLEQMDAESPLPATRSLLAVAYAAAGREAEAVALVDSFGGPEFPAVRQDCVWSSTTCMLAEVVGRFDAAPYAPGLYRLLLPFADRNCVVGGAILCLGPMSRYLGMLARVNGDHQRALQHLRHALARSRMLGSEPLVARTQLEKAKVRLARGADGDRTRAWELLAEVAETARKLGLAHLLADVAAVGRSAALEVVQA